MNDKPDDLDAVRIIVNALDPFEREDQERVIRWACEKLGIASAPTTVQQVQQVPEMPAQQPQQVRHTPAGDIRSFVADKNPTSDNQLAAVVAYFYQFEAPEHQRKEFITSEDLLEACRLAGKERLQNPGQTLRNAHGVGWLDKTGDRGAFRINTVGENLVAMTLPSGNTQPSTSRRKKSVKKKLVKKKAVKKQAATKKK